MPLLTDPVSDVASPVQKPGYKTTQFWLSLAAVMLGALVASGLLDAIPGEKDDQVVAMIMAALTAMGYGAQRTLVTMSGNKAAALVAASKPADPS